MVDFQTDAMRTAKPLPEEWALSHLAMLASGEAGELADGIKKHLIYGQPLDRENILEELGDLLWSVAYGAELMGESMETIGRLCIEKLQRRYPNAYSDHHAQERLDKI